PNCAYTHKKKTLRSSEKALYCLIASIACGSSGVFSCRASTKALASSVAETEDCDSFVAIFFPFVVDFTQPVEHRPALAWPAPVNSGCYSDLAACWRAEVP